jgi:hypothetical protein
MDKQAFLAACNLTESDLQEANISWEELSLIAEEYGKLEHSLREIGKSFIDEYLYDIETAGIHSYRYRTKRVEHLLEKVIRKRKENPEKFARLDHTKEAVQAHAGCHTEGLIGQERHADHTHKGSQAGCHEDTVPQGRAGIKIGQQVGVQRDDVSHGHECSQASHQLGFYIGSVFAEFENFLKHK